jgi:hypothetical protein
MTGITTGGNMPDQPDWVAPDPGTKPADPPPPTTPAAAGSAPLPAAPLPAAPPPRQGDWSEGRPKPGIVPLRPLSVSEILDGAISYIRSNPVATLALSAVVITITQLVQLPLAAWMISRVNSVVANPAAVTPDTIVGLFGVTLVSAGVGGLVTFVATTILTGLLIVVLGEAVLGRRTPLGAAWAAARGRVPGLLGLSLLTTLALVGVVAVGVVPGVLMLAFDTPGAVAVLVIASLVAACAAVFLGVAWSMAGPAYVLERIPLLGAYRRSFRLVRPSWWRIFGILLLGGLITAIVGALLSVPFSVISSAITGSFDPTTGAIPTGGVGGAVVSALGAIVSGTVTAPLSAGISGLLYIDQRMRREAFDLELVRAAQSPHAPVPGAPAGPPPNPAG